MLLASLKHVVCKLLTPLILLSSGTSRCLGQEPHADSTTTALPSYVSKLEPLLLEAMRAQHVPGALVYVDDPKHGRWSAALGHGDLDGAPMLRDSYMRVGSVTKTFTAVAVLRLVDRGLVNLAGPIETYLPGVVPNGARITVHQLLDMTAGLFNNTEDCHFNQQLDLNPALVETPQQSLETAFAHDAYFAPGTAFHYSNTNYIVLGLLVEKVTGKPLETALHDLIFAPLGMSHTFLPSVHEAKMRDPHVQGYLYGTNVQSLNAYVAAVTGDFLNSGILVNDGEKPLDATDWNPSYTWAAGGAVSTLGDLAIWAKANGTGALLKRQTFRKQNRLPKGSAYGLGINEVIRGFLGHDGAIPGYMSVSAYSPELNATIVVLTNSEVAPNTLLKDALPALKLATIIQESLFLRVKPLPSFKPTVNSAGGVAPVCADVLALSGGR